MATNEREAANRDGKAESRLDARNEPNQNEETASMEDKPNLDIKSTEESPQLVGNLQNEDDEKKGDTKILKGKPVMDEVSPDKDSDAVKKSLEQENDGAGAELKRVEEDISLKVMQDDPKDTKIPLELNETNRTLPQTTILEKK